MCFGLIFVHIFIPDLQHVGIVPSTRSGEALQSILVETKENHAIIVVPNIIGRTPHVAADGAAPLPNPFHAVLTQAVEDGTARPFESLAHFSECSNLIALSFQAAQVVLEKVNFPGGVYLSVLFL